MFIQLHNQYLPLSFKCLSEIDNISKFSLRLSFAWIKMFTEFCTFTLDKKSPRQSKPLFCLASAIISLGFSKIWINCKDFVLYLFCIREVSISGSQEIFQRGWIMIVFKVCFFDSCFKKFILSGNLHSLLFIFQGILMKRSYKRSYLENKQVIFFLELCYPELTMLQGRRNRPGLIRGPHYACGIWNGKFTLTIIHQMFSVETTSTAKFKNARIIGHFG